MSIDWNAIRDRMAVASAVIEKGAARSPEETRNILRARAQSLARQPVDAGMKGDFIEILEFRLANESYGIESLFISAVHPLKSLTPLPGMPPFVLGIVSVRGQTLCVIDLRKFFDLPGQGLSDLNKVVVARHNGVEFGILADAIVGFRTVPIGEIQSQLPTLTGIRQEHLKGVTPDQVIILDGATLLSGKMLMVNESL